MNRRPNAAPTFLPNADVWQVRTGLLLFIALTVGGIAWGVAAVAGMPQLERRDALVAFALGIVGGMVFGGAYVLMEGSRRGSFFIDDPSEYEHIRSGSSISGLRFAGLGAVAALALLAFRMHFVLGGALCGLMLAWAPIVIAGYARFEWRRRHG